MNQKHCCCSSLANKANIGYPEKIRRMCQIVTMYVPNSQDVPLRKSLSNKAESKLDS